MGFVDAVKSFFSRYVDFAGRSSRSEYWWAQLGLFLIGLVVGFIAGLLGELAIIVIGIFYLAIIIPSIALTVRRLHDNDKSGWWILIAFVPILGGLYLFYLFVIKGTTGPNRFGPDPLGSDSAVFN